jgi:hypothetical protein
LSAREAVFRELLLVTEFTGIFKPRELFSEMEEKQTQEEAE